MIVMVPETWFPFWLRVPDRECVVSESGYSAGLPIASKIEWFSVLGVAPSSAAPGQPEHEKKEPCYPF